MNSIMISIDYVILVSVVWLLCWNCYYNSGSDIVMIMILISWVICSKV